LPPIQEVNRVRIEKYITGIVNNNACQLYAIYANPDHVHFLISRSPSIDEQTLSTIIENSSGNFINENNLCVGRFEWQKTAAAFSVSKGDVDTVCKYILNQKIHHHNQTFAEEYELFIQHYQKTINIKK
jgi:REP element-mobilizing transposase RayT